MFSQEEFFPLARSIVASPIPTFRAKVQGLLALAWVTFFLEAEFQVGTIIICFVLVVGIIVVFVVLDSVVIVIAILIIIIVLGFVIIITILFVIIVGVIIREKKKDKFTTFIW